MIQASKILIATAFMALIPMGAYAQSAADSTDTGDADANAQDGATDAGDAEGADETAQPDSESTSVDTPNPAKTNRGKASGATQFKVVYAPPGCMDSAGEATFSLGSVLERHFEINNGDLYRTSYGPAALSNGLETILPEGTANDAARVDQLADAGELDWQVVEEDFPALVSPWETMIQVPFRGHFDWLSIVESETSSGGRFADTQRVTGRLSRAQLPDGSGLFRWDDPDSAQDPIFVRKWVTTYDIVAPDDAVQIISIGQSLGRGSRLRPKILRRLEEVDAGASIVLHAGGVTERGTSLEHRALCGEAAKGLNPMALVPRSGELVLGASGLVDFASTYGLRYVASNLVARATDERPFRRFSILNLDGLTVAVIGVVGADQLDVLPRGERDQWRLTDPVEALAQARTDLETQLQKKPDLTIVMLSTDDGSEFSRVSSVPGVDVVIGPFDRADLVPFEETTDVAEGEFRERRAAVRVGGNPHGVGEVVATFAELDGAAVARGFTHRVFPVIDEGEIDANLHRVFIPIEQAEAVRWSAPVLPDLVPIFESDESIRDRATVDGSERDPRGFSDALWSAFVGNELRRSFGADVAIVGRQQRSVDLVGAITFGQLGAWLDETTQVRVVELNGRQLRAIADHAKSGESAGQTPLFFAGFDPETGVVEGRPLRDELPYRVVVTDALAERDALDDVFARRRLMGRFALNDGRWSEAADGDVVTLQTAVLGALGSDVVPAPELRSRLRDPALQRDHQWRLNLRALSVRAHGRTNFGDQDFGETRETPVRVPNSLELGYRLDARLSYDGPAFAWDLGAFAQFDRLEFGEPESSYEPYDELYVTTEGRANLWGFEVGDAGFPLIPALGLTYDTEATPLPDATDPGTDLSRQQLIRINPALVAFPGDYLRRVDLGPVVQLDLVDGGAHVGLEAGYEAVFPIVGALEFESETTLRYLFPGSSDDAADLALRIDSRNAFVHPLVGGFGLALYADLYMVQGKTDPNDGIGGLFSAGAALRYSDAFRF